MEQHCSVAPRSGGRRQASLVLPVALLVVLGTTGCGQKGPLKAAPPPPIASGASSAPAR